MNAIDLDTDDEVAAINGNAAALAAAHANGADGDAGANGVRALPRPTVRRDRDTTPGKSILKPGGGGDSASPSHSSNHKNLNDDDDGNLQFEMDFVMARRHAFKDHIKKMPHW